MNCLHSSSCQPLEVSTGMFIPLTIYIYCTNVYWCVDMAIHDNPKHHGVVRHGVAAVVVVVVAASSLYTCLIYRTFWCKGLRFGLGRGLKSLKKGRGWKWCCGLDYDIVDKIIYRTMFCNDDNRCSDVYCGWTYVNDDYVWNKSRMETVPSVTCFENQAKNILHCWEMMNIWPKYYILSFWPQSWQKIQ